MASRKPSSFAGFWKEYKRNKAGIVGLAILIFLIVISISAAVLIPQETLRQWRNPSYWLENPKGAYPVWLTYFSEDLPQHIVLTNPTEETAQLGSIKIINSLHSFSYTSDGFPDDFIFSYTVRYTTSPVLVELSVKRPDETNLLLLKTTTSQKPPGLTSYTFNGTIYSTDRTVKRNLAQFLSQNFDTSVSPDDVIPSEAIFGVKPAVNSQNKQVLKGTYVFNATFLAFSPTDEVVSTKLIVGGRAFGVLGTDDLRRDLLAGILWGTPVALLIGLSVATLAVLIGVVYGVVAGYKGRRTDEIMMRANDIVFALPALPFLILLTIAIGKSVFFVIFYLILFGWVGTAKVARSIALQLKNLPYIESAELIGASGRRVMFKHLMPQIAPYTFASIALSVPSAILAEAGLSFLGLGDPTIPTWGQILHDAQNFGAAARGLWWWILPPGIMIAITGLAFVLIGTALDTVLNPKMRKR